MERTLGWNGGQNSGTAAQKSLFFLSFMHFLEYFLAHNRLELSSDKI